MVTKKNLAEIVKKLLSHVESSDGVTYRDEVVSKVIVICSQEHYQVCVCVCACVRVCVWSHLCGINIVLLFSLFGIYIFSFLCLLSLSPTLSGMFACWCS